MKHINLNTIKHLSFPINMVDTFLSYLWNSIWLLTQSQLSMSFRLQLVKGETIVKSFVSAANSRFLVGDTFLPSLMFCFVPLDKKLWFTKQRRNNATKWDLCTNVFISLLFVICKTKSVREYFNQNLLKYLNTCLLQIVVKLLTCIIKGNHVSALPLSYASIQTCTFQLHWWHIPIKSFHVH